VQPIPESEEVLNSLLLAGDGTLSTMLPAMGRDAQAIVPECVGLSLALLEDGLTFTLVASSTEFAGLDAIQYLDGGPCVKAALDDEVQDAEMAQSEVEERWQMYARTSAAAGVASSLTLPIERGGRVVGTVNLYAATAGAFHGHVHALAEALGASAEHAISNADLSFSTRLAAVEAPARLAEQAAIDIALGMIAEAQEVSITTARERLRTAAARAGITEAQAARAVRGILRPGA